MRSEAARMSSRVNATAPGANTPQTTLPNMSNAKIREVREVDMGEGNEEVGSGLSMQERAHYPV